VPTISRTEWKSSRSSSDGTIVIGDRSGQQAGITAGCAVPAKPARSGGGKASARLAGAPFETCSPRDARQTFTSEGEENPRANRAAPREKQVMANWYSAKLLFQSEVEAIKVLPCVRKAFE
jgi:hypothetical protein